MHLEQFFHLSLLFVTLMLKNTGQLFSRMSLSLHLSGVSLMIRFGLCVFGRTYVFFSAPLIRRHNTLIYPISWDIYFDYLVKMMFIMFVH